MADAVKMSIGRMLRAHQSSMAGLSQKNIDTKDNRLSLL